MKPNFLTAWRSHNPGNIRVYPQILLVAFVLISSFSHAQVTRTSAGSGQWSNKNTWVGGVVPGDNDNVIIAGGHTVTVHGANTVNHLTIQNGAVITDNNSNVVTTITGNLVVNGTLSGQGLVRLTGVNAEISGSGSITNTANLEVSNNKTILASANLAKNSGNLVITNTAVITNHGIITVGGSITGVSGSTWTNAQSSVLNIGGVLLSATGTVLNCSALNNTVNYFGQGAQAIKAPALVGGLSAYYHLRTSGSGVKTLAGTTDYLIAGDLINTATLSISNTSTSTRTVHVRGNWSNSGTFQHRLGTVILSGASDQTITRVGSGEIFNHLTIQKATGRVLLNSPVTVSGSLTFGAGNTANVYGAAHLLSVGTSQSNTGTVNVLGSGHVVGQLKRWINQSQVDVSFPVGTAEFSRHAVINITTLASGGSVTMQFVESYPGNAGLPMADNGVTLYNTFRDGYWSMTVNPAESLSAPSFNVRLTGTGFSGFAITPATRILSRTSASASWTATGSHVAATGNTAARNGLASGSVHQFAFADTRNCSAPVVRTITGETDVCAGSSFTYSVPNTPGNTYQWQVEGGTFSGNGTNSIQVTWGAVGTNGSVRVIESNSCTQGPTSTLPVRVHSIPPVFTEARYYAPEHGAMALTYSVNPTPGYAYNWTATGGTIVSGQGTNSVSVRWGSSGKSSLCVNGIATACGNTSSTCIQVEVYKVITSISSGNYNDESTWDCSCVPTTTDNVVIRSPHNVTINQNNATHYANHLIINAGATLTAGNTVGRVLQVEGDLILNGTLAGSSGTVNLDGSGTLINGVHRPSTIEGSGNITHTGPLNIRQSRTITGNTVLTKNTGAVTLASGVALNNFGRVTLGGDLVNADVAEPARWINNTNSTLSVAGAFFTSGILEAASSGNTVLYGGLTGLQTVKIPENGQYANLVLVGAVKLAPAETLKISENLSVDALLVTLPGSKVSFNGTSSILGNIIPAFHHVEVLGTLQSPATLNVGGNFSNYGNFIHNNGVVNFNGTSGISLINGSGVTSFYNIQINNISGVRAETNIDLFGVLQVSPSALFDADGISGSRTFTLRSISDAPALDGSIGPLLGGASVTGKVTAQRYMQADERMYRYMATPLSNTRIADWKDDFAITGNFTGASTGTVCGTKLNAKSPSMYYYNENHPDTTKRYIAYPTAAAGGVNAPVERGKGYAAFIRNSCDSVVVDVTGEVQAGSFTFTGLINSNHKTPHDGYQLLGNPYPSAIDWAHVDGWDPRTNIFDVAYIRDNKQGTFVPLDGNESTPQLIAMGQAFWVRVMNPGTGLLTVHESAKASGAHSFYRENTNIKDELIVRLSNGIITDKAFTKIRSFAETGRDKSDGLKMQNDDFDVFFISADGARMMINSTPEFTCDGPVRIGVRFSTEGRYSLSLEALGRFAGMGFQLRDEYSDKTVSLNDTGYDFVVTADAASKRADRFTLIQRQQFTGTPMELAYRSLTCDAAASLTIVKTLPDLTYELYAESDSLLASFPGNGTDWSYTVPPGVMREGSHQFRVQTVMSCGGVAETRFATIAMDKAPEGWNAIGGKSCGAGEVALRVEGVADGNHVKWYKSQSDVNPVYEGTLFNTGVLSKSSTWFAEVVSREGCTSPRVSVRAEVVYAVEPQLVDQGEQVLTTVNSDYVEWYFNDVLIDTATSIVMRESGTYSASTSLNGCSARSSYTFVIADTYERTPAIEVYPNPFTDYIVVPERGERILSVTLLDASGKACALRETGEGNGLRYDVSSLPSGVYVLRLVTASKTESVKLVRQ